MTEFLDPTTFAEVFGGTSENSPAILLPGND
jgi:hypothetical protein